MLARGELEQFEDDRDGEAIRVAAYSGIRLGELLALRWRDVDWTGSALTISRSLSSGVEGTTKTGHVRRVPMADQAAAALDLTDGRASPARFSCEIAAHVPMFDISAVI
ncbi:MAG: tyrosine-type recombinase/integrase [Solirubrobacteraceae bacterium]